MAFTRETARQLAQLAAGLDAVLNAQTRALVVAWARAFDSISPVLDDAVRSLLEVTPGRWPDKGDVYRSARARQALDLAASELQRLAQQANVTILADTSLVVEEAITAQPRLALSQLPPGPTAEELIERVRLVEPREVRAIVERTAGQVTARTFHLSGEATDRMKRELVKGIVVGDNPRSVAPKMLRNLEQGFNGGLTRALNISRTEMIDAHRAAATLQQRAMNEVLAGWTWYCQCDKRSCPACFAMHGSEHPGDEDGPQDHQQGRCARMPLTRSWRDLGFDLDEPASLLRSGREQFDALSGADQLAVMGPGRLDALQSGLVRFEDLATRRSTPGWRDSFAPTPVRDLIGSR